MVRQEDGDAALHRVAQMAVFANQNGFEGFSGVPLGLGCRDQETSRSALTLKLGEEFRRGKRQPLAGLGAAQQFKKLGSDGHHSTVYTTNEPQKGENLVSTWVRQKNSRKGAKDAKGEK